MRYIIYTAMVLFGIGFSGIIVPNTSHVESAHLFPSPPSCTIGCQKNIKKYKQAYTSECFCCPRKPTAFGYNVIRDMGSIFAHIIDWDTIKILVGLFPVFIGARMLDEPIQNHFFCHGCHSNINQMPRWCYETAQWGVAVPVIALGSLAFLAKDFELRYTGWMLLLGWPFLIFGKDTIKQFEADCCLRPWNEDFCKKVHKRWGGGFPSGHMAEATYMTVIFGLRYGPKAGIPLGLFTAGIGAVFLTANRHYLSQLIAGVGLGAIFAVAANKVIDHRLVERLSMGFGCDSQGNPGLSVSYKF